MSAYNKDYNTKKYMYIFLRFITALIGLHALILGLLNWLFTHSWLNILNMPILAEFPFWEKQSGAMHVGLAFAYGLGAILPRYLHASVRLIIISKSVAVFFLFSTYFLHGKQLVVLLAGLGDTSILLVISMFALKIYHYRLIQKQSIQN